MEGTPADCVRLGLFSLHPETDWVLAGINNGGNLGVDFHHSGTVSAVREAVINGKPGIAVSHFHHRGVLLDWERASSLVAPIIRQILSLPVKKGIMWNINLPNLDPKSSDPEVVHCPLDTNPLPLEFFNDGNFFRYNGNYWGRKRDPGSDVDVCFGGKISVTCVNLFSISIGCD